MCIRDRFPPADPIQRAADFYQVVRQSYAGNGKQFSPVARSMWAGFPAIDRVAGRLQGVKMCIRDSLSGDSLMACAIEILSSAQRNVGGGVVYLECEDKPKLLQFYENDNNRFRPFGRRFSEKDGVEYIQLLRFF